MADIVNTGAAANDGSGDDLRTSFQLINQRFQQLLGTLSQITWAPGLAISATPLRQWTVVAGQAYVAASNHTAGATFADDLAAARWLAVDVAQLIADLASPASGKGAEMIAFKQSGTGAVTRTVQDKTLEIPASLYDFGGTFEGDCIAAMDLALASTVKRIVVPDGVTLGKHTITRDDVEIIGGKNITFSSSVAGAGFVIGTSGRVLIKDFKDVTLPAYPDTGGVIADGAAFISIAPGATVGELYAYGCSGSGGRIGISAGFESGRTLLNRCEIIGNKFSGQNGGLGGEGYGIHYANENDTGEAIIGYNIIEEAGRHSFYVARNKGGGVVHLVGNKAKNHRENATTKGDEVRTAYLLGRCSNVQGHSNSVDGFYDGALMISEETEAVGSPLNTDNVQLFGTTIRNPKNVAAAIWCGYATPSESATINSVLLDGVIYDSSLNGSQVFNYSWGRNVKLKNIDVTYRNTTAGSRMFVLKGNATGNTAGLSIEGVRINLLGCAGTFSIVRPIEPFATSSMPLSVRDIRRISNTGDATVNDWEPSVTMTNTEIDVFGFSWPSASTASPKQVEFPSGITSVIASTTWDPPSIGAGSTAALNVTVTGAVVGDFAVASFSNNIGSLSLTAAVVSTNTVTVRFSNNSASSIDLASGTLKVLVMKKI